jgi:cytochrome c oxidase subunit 2
MWHIQHANGIRENDELHVPVGKAVNLTFISQDVIHDFFVPAFRIHTDVIPGHYTNAWFEATKVGVYDLFCGQYCGTQHSEMIGKVYVMEPAAYQAWLASGGDKQVTKRQSIAESGEEIFNRFQCVQCHGFAPARAPSLVDLHNTPVRLEDGRAVLADDNYLRESIIDPPKKVVEGYQPVMASYQNSLSEDQVLQLVAFIKSLRSGNKAVAPAEGNRQEGKQQ